MKKTAGFLKFCCTFAMVFLVFGIVILALTGGFLIAVGSLSELAGKAGKAITIDAGTLTPAELDALKPVVLIALCFALVSVVLALIGTINTRKALKECQKETPFSDISVNSLLTSARMEIIAGVIGIIGGFVVSFMASKLTVNGSPIGSSMSTINLSFVFYAVMKYLLYHIAEYGRKLERR